MKTQYIYQMQKDIDNLKEKSFPKDFGTLNMLTNASVTEIIFPSDFAEGEYICVGGTYPILCTGEDAHITDGSLVSSYYQNTEPGLGINFSNSTKYQNSLIVNIGQKPMHYETNSVTLYNELKLYAHERDVIKLTKRNCTDIIIEISQLKSDAESLGEYTGIKGQVVVNTDDNSIHVMDGVTRGGHSLFPMVKLTQAEYDAITSKHPNTLYIITG